jgi:hypothetical protein
VTSATVATRANALAADTALRYLPTDGAVARESDVAS